MQWLSNLLSRRQRYDDVSVSIREHLEERVDELVEDGMPRHEAEQKARREFGNVTLLQEHSREAWQWSGVENLLADTKLALRRLYKSPGFTMTVLLTLGIGMGANTAVFSVINSVLLRPLKYPEPDRLVALHQEAPGAAGLAAFASGLRLSPSMYFTYAENTRTMQSVGIWMRKTANVTGIASPEEVRTINVTDGLLEALSVPPLAGRWFSHTDQDPHGARTAMLSYGYWKQRFGGDPSVIGRTIQIDAQSVQVIGVMPGGFRVDNRDFDLILPLRFERNNQPLAGFGFEGVARLKPGVSIAQANADIARMLPIWMDSFTNGPGTDSRPFYKAWRITPALRPLKQEIIGDTRNVLWVVMATIGLVMLIACTNVTNLLLVRADARQQELSVRAALGAGRARMVRELLLESVLLGLMGGVLGVGIAYLGLRVLTAIGPADLPRLNEVSMDFASLAFTFLLSLLAGLVFGSIPALKYARVRGPALLSGSTRTMSLGREGVHSRNVMVVAQVAMAMVLLVCALLMIRTFQTLRHVEPGFTNARHVQTMRVSIPESMISDPVAVTRLEQSIADKLATVAGVTSVGFGSSVPMDGLEFGWDEIRVVGKSYDHVSPPLRLFNYISPGYFPTLGSRMIAGRDFHWVEIYGAQHPAILTENLARELFGTPEAAIGQHFQRYASPVTEVVGVVEDIHQNGVDQKPPALVYWPVLRVEFQGKKPAVYASSTIAYVVRSDRSGSAGFFSELEHAVWSVNGNLPVPLIETMQDVYDRSLEKTSFALVMLAIAGSMALALGIIGIYGVIAFAVMQRTREIGIRVALGAQKGELKWMFVRSAMHMTGFGVMIGAAAAAGLTQLMKSLLYGISPLDPFTFVVIPLVLVASAVLASYLPARRAASVDPVEALRAE